LICAGLFLRTLRHATSIDLGFRAENVLLLQTSISRYSEAQAINLYRVTMNRLRTFPGVLSVTLAGDAPMAGGGGQVWLTRINALAGYTDWLNAGFHSVGPGYFETLGIPLVRGRDFRESDDANATRVAIINESMARSYWPGEDPVGTFITFPGRTGESVEIVGIARDVYQRSLFINPLPCVYMPLLQRYKRDFIVHVRVAAGAGANVMLERIRKELSELNRGVPVYNVRLLTDQIEQSLSQQRMAAILLSWFGVGAAILASFGIYGIVAYSVTQRTRELGIRIALGSARYRVVGLVLKDVAMLVGFGTAIGFVAAYSLRGLVSTFLFGISATDSITYAAVAAIVMASAFGACAPPALRACKIEPAITLRDE
jgi:predicted permease